MFCYSEEKTIKGYRIFRIQNDINGNGRYVVHYLAFHRNFGEALRIARKWGGKKYRAKSFGGGIVFQDSGEMAFTERFRMD